jgi:transposase-like protein
MIEALRAVIKRLHYPLEVMLTCVRWYVAYPLSLRHIEEMMAERSVFVDHATIHRWALKIVPALVKVFRGRTRPVGKSWRMDETYIKVRGQRKYVYYWLWVSRQVGFSGNVMKLRRFGDIA